jgi:hypothetical protein
MVVNLMGKACGGGGGNIPNQTGFMGFLRIDYSD